MCRWVSLFPYLFFSFSFFLLSFLSRPCPFPFFFKFSYRPSRFTDHLCLCITKTSPLGARIHFARLNSRSVSQGKRQFWCQPHLGNISASIFKSYLLILFFYILFFIFIFFCKLFFRYCCDVDSFLLRQIY